MSRMLLAAIDATPVSMTLSGPVAEGNRLTYVNAAFERTTGYSPAESVGRNCRFLQGAATDPDAVATIRKGIADGTGCQIELLNYRKDGKPFWNQLTVSPLRDPAGALLGFVGVQVDVTEIRAARQRLADKQRLESLGQLAGGVAHELNNLLQPVLTYPDLIRQTLPSTAVIEAEWLDTITESARSARQIVRSILTFARPGRQAAEPIDATAGLIGAVDFVESLTSPGLEIVRLGALASGEPVGSIDANGTELQQVVTNLITNASHATRGVGRVELDLRVDGGAVILTCTDDGPGVPAAIRDRIFDPFFTTKPLNVGTGLGLSVVLGLVRGWGGDIRLDTAPGRGARFTMTVPLANPSVQPLRKVT